MVFTRIAAGVVAGVHGCVVVSEEKSSGVCLIDVIV